MIWYCVVVMFVNYFMVIVIDLCGYGVLGWLLSDVWYMLYLKCVMVVD